MSVPGINRFTVAIRFSIVLCTWRCCQKSIFVERISNLPPKVAPLKAILHGTRDFVRLGLKPEQVSSILDQDAVSPVKDI